MTALNVEKCLFQDECPFFQKMAKTVAEKMMLTLYCQAVPSKCEILTYAIRGYPIPENMLPDGGIDA